MKLGTYSLQIRTQPLFTLKGIIFGNRRAKNLKDILTRAKISYDNNATRDTPSIPLSQTINECTRNNCRYCPLINTTDPVINLSTGRPYNVINNITCNSNNLVYVIACRRCGILYVGETYRSLRERLLGHFGDVQRNANGKTVAEHYNKPDHNGWKDMKISGLYYCPLARATPNNMGQGALRERWRMEWRWICKLSSLSPWGLNSASDRRRGGFAI